MSHMTISEYIASRAAQRRREWYDLIVDWDDHNPGAPLPPWLERRADFALAWVSFLEALARTLDGVALVGRPSRWPISWPLIMDAVWTVLLLGALAFVLLAWFV
jgi:hypothetical protein